MAISTFCLGCRSLLRLPDEMAGKQVRCEKCKQMFTVPGVLSTGPTKSPPKIASRAEPAPEAAPPPMPAAPPIPPSALPPSALPPPSSPSPAAPPRGAIPMAPPRPMPPPPRRSEPKAPTDAGVPGVVLVEVPTKPVPPPMPEEGAPARSPRGESADPGRHAIPPMNLSGRERPRRTNRPRHPTSVTAGLLLTAMSLLFVALLITSGATWVWGMASKPPIQQGQFVVGPQQKDLLIKDMPKDAVKDKLKDGGPIIVNPQIVNPPQVIAESNNPVFNPRPSGDRFDDKRAIPIKVENGILVRPDTLTNNDPIDPVRRKGQDLPCKVFLVELDAKKRYRIDYERAEPIAPLDQFNVANNPDPYLRIESQDGQRLIEHDDIVLGTKTDSRIDYIPPKTGTYRIFCTLFQYRLPGAPMNFKLSIREEGGPLPEPRVLKEQVLARKEGTQGDLKVVTVNSPNLGAMVGDVSWSADGRSFFALHTNGTLVRIALDSFVEQRRLELGRAVGNASMAMSAQGLIVAIPSINELWLIDPDDMQVRKRYGVFPATAVASSPSCNYAFVSAPTYFGRSIVVLDLAKDVPLRVRDAANLSPAVSPDGALLFAMDNDVLHEFQIKGDGELMLKQTSGQLGLNLGKPRRIEISADSRFVCAAGSLDAARLPNHRNDEPSPAYVYPVDNLRKPAFSISTGVILRSVGFDLNADRIYTHADGFPLVVYDGRGIRRTNHTLPNAGAPQDVPLQFLTHPDGNKVLIRFPSKLCYVTLKANAPPIAKVDPFPTPTPLKDAVTIAGDPTKKSDVTYRDLSLPGDGIQPCWDADGQAFFQLDADGVLTRIAAGTFVPQIRLNLGKPAAAMALSQKGLLVALRDQPEIWRIDPRSLTVLNAIRLTSPARYQASHPKQTRAVAVGAEVKLIDLAGDALRGMPAPEAGQSFHSPALTPDGKYLFLCQAGGGTSKVLRIHFDTAAVEDTKVAPVKDRQVFCITANGEHVAWFSPLTKNKERETAFYPVADWKTAAFTLAVSARAMACASDGSLLVHTHDNKTMVFGADRTKSTPLPFVEGRVHEFMPHPQNPRVFLASNGKTVYHGERQ